MARGEDRDSSMVLALGKAMGRKTETDYDATQPLRVSLVGAYSVFVVNEFV